MHKMTVDVEKLLEIGIFAEDDAGHIFALEGDWSSHEKATEIQEIREHLNMEIGLVVFELEEAMIVAMAAFTFPLAMILTFTFTRYTNRNFNWRFSHVIDMCIFALVIVWFLKYEEYIHSENDGFRL